MSYGLALAPQRWLSWYNCSTHDLQGGEPGGYTLSPIPLLGGLAVLGITPIDTFTARLLRCPHLWRLRHVLREFPLSEAPPVRKGRAVCLTLAVIDTAVGGLPSPIGNRSGHP
jgi:hypothetical protein